VTAPAVLHPGELRWETRLVAVVTATLVVFGLAAAYGAANVDAGDAAMRVLLRQLSGAALGGILMVVVARVDYRLWRRLAWPMLGFTVFTLLILVLPFTKGIAPVSNGARRWLYVGPLNFQPSELARLTIVVWCAMLAEKKGKQVRQFKKGVMPFLVMIGLVSGLILLQPNLSMATLVALLGCLVLFTAGAKIGHFMLLAFGGGLLVWHKIVGTGFRSARLAAFLDPGSAASGAGYQLDQSMIGIGSGGIVGVGFGEGQQKLFLPYASNDFLFSSIGEEWGFIGVVVVVGLFALFCWTGLRIARTAEDPFGQYLAVGLTATVGVTAVMHMAVSLGMMPTTGITLPFMSTGRSSQVIALVGTGMLINIGRQRGRRRRRTPRSSGES
jgi:cell division protein FtsW